MTGVIALFIAHGLISIVLLGAVTHQCAAAWRLGAGQGLWARYCKVAAPSFVGIICWSYVLSFALGALVYPEYRMVARLAFEELRLGWAVGAFELKEHWGALALAMLPLYVQSWREVTVAQGVQGPALVQARWLTTLITLVVWYNLVIGHILNNMRGIG